MVRICENCRKEHDGSYGSGRFCCKECAKSFSTKNIGLKEVKCINCGKVFLIDKRANPTQFYCDNCKKLNSKRYVKIGNNIIKKSELNCNYFNIDCKDCYFHINNICNGKNSIGQKLNNLKKYCNLEISDYQTTLDNYLKIKNNIQYLIDSGYSCVDICKSIFKGNKKGNTIFKTLGINVKTLSEAVSNAFLQGKFDNIELWYKTWMGNEIYLRSSYEVDFAKELDKKQIKYQYEPFQIKYYDSYQKKIRCAIPDFYLPETNTIIEIKSTWTLNLSEMKDKAKAYKEQGYNFKFILEHKEEDINKL